MHRFYLAKHRNELDKYRIKNGEHRMEDEIKRDVERLKLEIEELKSQLKEKTERRRRSDRGVYIDIGERVGDYVEDVMEGVVEGIHGEIEKSIFIGPHGRHIKIRGPEADLHRYRADREEDEAPADFVKIAQVMSALGQEQRLKILNELMSGGKYVNELQEKLADIAASTLSSHLNVLEEAGLVVQERVRGRYLVTIPGRSAFKMARRVSRIAERRHDE
ncbi:MAG: winged helix-turn-helix transcriptional regulator [Candidatus Bathyarchaeota archaeon]|nr:MAG: winged helix-turn-helix transcriptional regulator [Candidatus Bathyarchaeota archaeon]